ncbi:protein phosphatase Slingshot homolog 2 isoform X2 [Periophthalmus magnuspinnatus]|uniref:protein phosphatase Slingshot homolog 2 isoform X2 n=1 Tax=Periophthalmus magnuspinnatus TaxID=409849 RepID=UPI0024373FD6|nr:protein phosphatase Slingshot homolog 2 isoform X2 [Periophthalmus magnuspinnatus]
MALVTVQRSPSPSTTSTSTSSPCVSEAGSGEDDRRSQQRSISESFLTVKGAALFLPRGNSPTPNSAPRLSQRRNKHTGDLQKHLQTMFTVLRPEDTIRLAVRLESAFPQVTRYMVVVSNNGRQDTEESIVLGMDFVSSDSCCSVGLVLPLWSDTMIHLDGDGGFSVSTVNRVHVFKPVSVQAMWSALQSLHKACDVARCHNYYPGSLFLTWVSYYQSRVSSSQICVNEWNAMQDVESHRASSPVLFTDLPTERERTERLIRLRLREIMMQKDLENVTCKEIRTELEMQMVCNLRDFKGFIDNEMIVILGQMDSPTEIFDHVFLGSEWNASNLEELQNSGVRYILNVTREIDNFFPGMFEYHNIRVYDEEATNLLEYWNDTYKFITKAKKAGAKCLVHCKMGISRSASTVIAYAMKEYGWNLDTALEYVKDKRSITKPNPSFMRQLEEYQGILLASKQRHNKLWRSHSDSDLSDRSDASCKRPQTLTRSDSHNNNSIPSSPSLHHFLGVAVLQALTSDPVSSSPSSSPDSRSSDGGETPNHEEEVTPIPNILPRPRAAVVIPEDAVDNSARVAITVPLALPQPPPSIHILPSTPKMKHGEPATTQPAEPATTTQPAEPATTTQPAETQPATTTQPAELATTQPADAVPELKLSLDLPEEHAPDTSPLTLGSTDTDVQDLSDLSEKVTPLSSAASGLTLSPLQSDDNNNPSHLNVDNATESRGEADGASTHSSDSIDFFSAREKFLGLALDGRLQKQTEQETHPPLPSAAEEENKDTETKEDDKTEKENSQTEDGADPAHHPDNCISVRHIVTEIEAISHPAPSTITTSSSSPSLQLPHPEPHIDSGLDPASPGPPTALQPAAVLPGEWPIGSVRRATKQLEQKMKREMLAARSTLHSPSNENSLVRSLQQTECTNDSEHDTQGQVETPKDCDENIQILDTSDFNSSCSQDTGGVRAATESQTDRALQTKSPSLGSSLHTSTSAQRLHISQDVEPQNVTVDGVTVQDSDTDEKCVQVLGCSPDCEAQNKLARGSQELERIQQTLKELQAFLCDGVNLENQLSDKMDTEISKDAQSYLSFDVAERIKEEQKSEPTGWHRAIELEARLRQAGLTPPSLMKRSASLAKLDSLELSANDLNDLDLTSQTKTTSSHSRKSKLHRKEKQKLLAHISNVVRLSSDQTEEEKSTSCCQKEDVGEGVKLAQKQGRRHSASSGRSRKLSIDKKHRAVTVLYNTM